MWKGIPMAKIRPQIMMGLIVLGSTTIYAIHLGIESVATATIGGIIALSMKILEGD